MKATASCVYIATVCLKLVCIISTYVKSVSDHMLMLHTMACNCLWDSAHCRFYCLLLFCCGLFVCLVGWLAFLLLVVVFCLFDFLFWFGFVICFLFICFCFSFFEGIRIWTVKLKTSLIQSSWLSYLSIWCVKKRYSPMRPVCSSESWQSP